MDRVLVLITANKDIITNLVKLVQDMLPGLRIVVLYDNVHKLIYYLEKTSLASTEIAVVNTICTKPLVLDRDQFRNLHIFNLCFSCCKEDHDKDTLCLPPYISLARVLVNRIKMLFENIEELKASIKISAQESVLLTELLGIEQNLLNQMMSSCLLKEESYYSITVPTEDTSITITAVGSIRGYKEKALFSAQYTVHDKPKCISSFFAQTISILTLWLYCMEHLRKCSDVITKIGYEEGFYTLYTSKLVECGADFVVKLSFSEK